ncbi:MAG: hypothetical protein AAFU79_02420 [Myxococcota bacterium]
MSEPTFVSGGVVRALTAGFLVVGAFLATFFVPDMLNLAALSRREWHQGLG